MDKPRSLEPSVEEAAEMRTAIEGYIADVERLREQMKRDQRDIERSRERTRAMLARLKAG